MIGALASIHQPDRFETLTMIGPSPHYINEKDYFGGFERSDIDSLLDSLESNHVAWSAAMAPVIMGNADRPELAGELEASFCRMDPFLAHHFARVTFLSDNRADLPLVANANADPSMPKRCHCGDTRGRICPPVPKKQPTRDHGRKRTLPPHERAEGSGQGDSPLSPIMPSRH